MAPADIDLEFSGVYCRLDTLLAQRNMTLKELSDRVGVSVVNLSVLKNNRAKAIRFSTLVAVCTVLECEIGQLLSLQPEPL